MIIGDMHCDLPYKIFKGSHNLHFDINRLSQRHGYIQIFAAFTDKLETDNPNAAAKKMIAAFKEYAGACEKADIITNYKEPEHGKVCGILSVEGGEALGGQLSELEVFYNMGVRLMTLTWNYPNMLGEGVGALTKNRGLTEFGREVVREMNRINMVVDVSHLTQNGFFDVAQESSKAFCATHSNSYAVCPHLRNITDEQFCEIKNRGGLVGINLYPYFLTGSESASLCDVVRHIEHFMSLGGENTLALGCDLDGVDCLPDGFCGIGDIEKLIAELKKINYSDEIIAKIMGENLKKYLKSVVL